MEVVEVSLENAEVNLEVVEVREVEGRQGQLKDAKVSQLKDAKVSLEVVEVSLEDAEVSLEVVVVILEVGGRRGQLGTGRISWTPRGR